MSAALARSSRWRASVATNRSSSQPSAKLRCRRPIESDWCQERTPRTRFLADGVGAKSAGNKAGKREKTIFVAGRCSSSVVDAIRKQIEAQSPRLESVSTSVDLPLSSRKPPPVLSSFGRASLTLRARPPTFVPFKAVIAWSAAASGISNVLNYTS